MVITILAFVGIIWVKQAFFYESITMIYISKTELTKFKPQIIFRSSIHVLFRTKMDVPAYATYLVVGEP